jgi:hypothetical protein
LGVLPMTMLTFARTDLRAVTIRLLTFIALDRRGILPDRVAV